MSDLSLVFRVCASTCFVVVRLLFFSVAFVLLFAFSFVMLSLFCASALLRSLSRLTLQSCCVFVHSVVSSCFAFAKLAILRVHAFVSFDCCVRVGITFRLS